MATVIAREIFKVMRMSRGARTAAAAAFLVAVPIAAALFPTAAGATAALRCVDDAVAAVRSPDDIADFFSREFAYTMTLPDRAHSPDETIEARTGDCEDFAVLASVMLARMGVANRAVVIKFRGLRVAHAICIWKAPNGLYNFISNRELVRTGKDTVEGAIMKHYPDCESVTDIDTGAYAEGGRAHSASQDSRNYRGAELMADLDPRLGVGL
jgi:hypothetical protein